MTAKYPKSSAFSAGLRATRLGMGTAPIKIADGAGLGLPTRSTQPGLATGSDSVPGGSLPHSSVADRADNDKSDNDRADERAVGSRPGFDFRMPPRAPAEPGVGDLEPRAVVVSQTPSARVFLKPGQLPEWMGIASVKAHPRKSGTFMIGSPASPPPSEKPGSPKSSAPEPQAGVSFVKAPLTSAPPPAPYRRPLLRRPAISGKPTDSGSPSVVYSSPVGASGAAPPIGPTLAHSVGREADSRKTNSRRSASGSLRTWALRLVGVVAAGALLGAIASYPISRSTRAPGVLRAARGPQTISASSTGAVVKLLVTAGAEVTKGQPLVRIESLQLDVSAARYRREWTSLLDEFAASQQDNKVLAERRFTLVGERRGLLKHRLRLKEDELVHRRHRVVEMQRLFDDGIASPVHLSDAKAALQATTEGKLSIDTELSALEMQQSEREHSDRQQRRRRKLKLVSAEASVRDAERMLSLSVVRAPVAGWVEAFSVVPGAVVQPGTAVARLIPQASPTTIVAFVPASQSAHVREGTDGTVRFDSLADELGELGARIVRVSREVASPAGVEALLGASPAVPMVRVELELLDEPGYYRLQPLLRSGSPVVVSMDTVERRVIDILWNTIGGWLS